MMRTFFFSEYIDCSKLIANCRKLIESHCYYFGSLWFFIFSSVLVFSFMNIDSILKKLY